MSDLDLRSLERKARSQPEDVGVGLAYARALGRGGDRAAQVRELSRLVRQGNLQAARELATLTPWQSVNGANRSRRSRRTGLRTIRRVRCFDLPATPPDTSRELVGATDQFLAFTTSEGLEVVSHGTGETAWRVVAPGPWQQRRSFLCITRRADVCAATVSDAVLVAFDGCLELRNAADGSMRSRTELGLRPRAIAIEGDRLVLRTADSEENGLIVLDVGERFGRELWRSSLDPSVDADLDWFFGWSPTIVRGLVVVRVPGALEARRVDTGELVWRSGLARHGRVLAVDELGVIVQDGRRQRAISLEDGRTDRARNRVLDDPFCLGDDVIVGCARRADRVEGTVDGMHEVSVSVSYELAALDRSSGTRRWAVPLERVPEQVVALTDDVVYVLTPDYGAKLSAFDLGTGTQIFEVTLAGFGSRPHATFEAIPVEGGLVVVALSDNRASFARIE